MNIFVVLVLSIGFLVVLSCGVGTLALGAKLCSGRRGHRRTSERAVGLVFMVFGLALILFAITLLNDTGWLYRLAFLTLFTGFGLWLLTASLYVREHRAARLRDLELGLPVTGRLRHPGWIALTWFTVDVVVSVGGLVAPAALSDELVQQGLLSPAGAAHLQTVAPTLVLGVCAATVVGGTAHVVLQMVHRHHEAKLVARTQSATSSTDSPVQPPRD
ncbi:hypothetical protein [Kineococcus rhizosphaerae]|uniref:Uncharacterized protein n=1 Tax=Kineococcus rhizosphaerae TaxID=559628 RepID=A0A2T0QMH2_9ACTN|nr:hypothetical protein [Kineococcus rhizosphaerae]PRY05743.1 hypothetical protein CLV37_1374 [Kineococcus rhizosphaerae]